MWMTCLLYSIQKGFTSLPNIRVSSMKITFEIRNKEQLRFLDVPIIKNYTTELEFDVLRKNTHTHWYIPSNTHHSKQHKLAKLKFQFHRLYGFPFNSNRFEEEKSNYHKGNSCKYGASTIRRKKLRLIEWY